MIISINFFDSECQCDIRGIAANNGCNQDDGSCTCKRNVVNRDCDQCAEEHYGLSESDPLGKALTTDSLRSCEYSKKKQII